MQVFQDFAHLRFLPQVISPSERCNMPGSDVRGVWNLSGEVPEMTFLNMHP